MPVGARVQNRRAEIAAERRHHVEATIPSKRRFEKRRNKAQRHSKHRQQVMRSTDCSGSGIEKALAGRHRDNGTPEKSASVTLTPIA
jgi:hypothetical protein